MFKKILTALIFLFLTAFLATGYAAEKKARDFELCDLENNRVSLESLLGKGPVYIALWATWCKPCIKELEIVSRMYEEYKDRGFLLVGINEDSGRSYSKVKSFVKTKGWTFPILLDSDEKVKRDYRAFGLPYSVIVDPEGNIIHTAYGFRPGDESKVIELIEPFLTQPEEDEEEHHDEQSLKKN